MAFALQAANKQLLKVDAHHAHEEAEASLSTGQPKIIRRMCSRARFKEEPLPSVALRWPKFLFTKGAFYCNVICVSPLFQHFITAVIIIASVLVCRMP